MIRRLVLLLLVAAGLVAASFCIVVLDEREQGFRTLLQDPDFQVAGIPLNRPELTEPGVYVRIPGLHQLYVYDRRLQRFDSDPHNLYTGEETLLEVDYYAMWRIENPRQFFESNRTQRGALQRIDEITYDTLRAVLAHQSLKSLLSPERDEILESITRRSDEQLSLHGIRVIDLRIRRIDFPEENIERVFERMRTDQERVAKGHRAEGEEQARRIRSEADRESLVLAADATRESEQLRGEGDAEAARVYAEAYQADPEFYSFVRSLEAYRRTIDAGTTLVVSPHSGFLRHLLPQDGDVPAASAPDGAPRVPAPAQP